MMFGDNIGLLKPRSASAQMNVDLLEGGNVGVGG